MGKLCCPKFTQKVVTSSTSECMTLIGTRVAADVTSGVHPCAIQLMSLQERELG